MTTVRPHYRIPIALGVFLNLITNIAVLLTRVNYREDIREDTREDIITYKAVVLQYHKAQTTHKLTIFAHYRGYSTSGLTYCYTFHHAFICCLHELLTAVIYLSNVKRLIEITVITIVVDCNVNYGMGTKIK